jgi:hypothetical protein
MLLVAPMPPPAEGCSKPGDLLLCQIAFQPDTRKREIGSVYSADDADGADAKQRTVTFSQLCEIRRDRRCRDLCATVTPKIKRPSDSLERCDSVRPSVGDSAISRLPLNHRASTTYSRDTERHCLDH